MIVFVYGTLKKGFHNDLYDGQFICNHTLKGYTLYGRGFPWLVPEAGKYVIGEVQIIPRRRSLEVVRLESGYEPVTKILEIPKSALSVEAKAALRVYFIEYGMKEELKKLNARLCFSIQLSVIMFIPDKSAQERAKKLFKYGSIFPQERTV